MESKNKKIIVCSFIFIIMCVCIGIYFFTKNCSGDKKTNNDLDNISNNLENYNWNDIKLILDKNNNSDFDDTVYEKIYYYCEEKAEIVKQGNEDSKIIDFINKIIEDIPSEQKEKFKNLKNNIITYNEINHIDNMIEEHNYMYTHDFLKEAIKEYSDDEVYVEKIREKRNSILDNVFDEVINSAQKAIDEKKYQEAFDILRNYTSYEYTIYKNEKTEKIVDMNDRVLQILIDENENKKNEENRQKEESIKDKKDKIIVNTSGKKIYKVCMASNTFSIKGNFKGEGHFSIKLLDENQELYKLITNEIGDYVIDKSVSVKKGTYYYLQIETTRGDWNLEWQGTYGE